MGSFLIQKYPNLYDKIIKYGIIKTYTKRGLEYQPNDIVNMIIKKLDLIDQKKYLIKSNLHM